MLSSFASRFSPGFERSGSRFHFCLFLGYGSLPAITLGDGLLVRTIVIRIILIVYFFKYVALPLS